MRTPLLICVATCLPQVALADCVYSGAKRAYLECIYNAALTNAADLLSLDAATTAVQADLSSLAADVDSRITPIEGDVADAQGMIAALQAETADLWDDLSALMTSVTDLDTRMALVEAGSGSAQTQLSQQSVFVVPQMSSQPAIGGQTVPTNYCPATSVTLPAGGTYRVDATWAGNAGSCQYASCVPTIGGQAILTGSDTFPGIIGWSGGWYSSSVHGRVELVSGGATSVQWNCTFQGGCTGNLECQRFGTVLTGPF